MNIVILFAVCTAVNVILSTIKSIATVNGGKWIAALMNAITYGFYTWVIILTNAEMPLWEKMAITAACNFLGVFIVKLIEEKARKDKMWKIEMALKGLDDIKAVGIKQALENAGIPTNYQFAGKWTIFNCYCATKLDTQFITDYCTLHNGKISAYESKTLAL